MKKSQYSILLLLTILFAAPGMAAYWFYQHPTWLHSSRVNKGILLNPPILLASKALNNPKWKMILWSPESCRADCLQQLDLLARIRLALGRKWYEVDQLLLLDEEQPLITERLQSTLKEKDFHLALLTINEKEKLNAVPANTKIFIANPENYLVLAYPLLGNPDDIYKDLKRLLDTSNAK